MAGSVEWSRSRMLGRASPLAASLPFAPQSLQDAIVALRAVISEIAAVPDTVSDPEVGRRKLAWWGDALRRQASHPAIEDLVTSGAADRLDPERFQPLIARVAATLEAPRFELSDDAWAHCLALGGPAASLEAALVEPDAESTEDWAALGGFAYLVRLVRDLGIDARANRWPVPLDLQAEYQVARQDVAGGSVSRGFDGMVRAWLADGSRRAGDALAALPAGQCWRQRHLLVSHALDQRLARVLARRPRRLLEQRVQPGHIGNVWQAWREARRLARAAKVGVSRN